MIYGRDVAHVHDTGHADFARGAARWLVGILEPPGVVVDLGCGSGITARALVDAGFDVSGVDISEALLEIARERVPEARLECRSWVDHELEDGCLAITAISEVFNYAEDPRVSPRELSAFFERAFAALAPGGRLVFDALEPGRDGTSRTFDERDGWLVCVETVQEGDELTRSITTFRHLGQVWRRSDETHAVRLLEREWVSSELRAAGFEVEVLDGYGEMAFREGLAGYCATKP